MILLGSASDSGLFMSCVGLLSKCYKDANTERSTSASRVSLRVDTAAYGPVCHEGAQMEVCRLTSRREVRDCQRQGMRVYTRGFRGVARNGIPGSHKVAKQ